MSDPELIRKQQAHIVRVARKMLDREVGIIEAENTHRQEALAACRLILRRFQADFDESQ